MGVPFLLGVFYCILQITSSCAFQDVLYRECAITKKTVYDFHVPKLIDDHEQVSVQIYSCFLLLEAFFRQLVQQADYS